jgi:ADP-heptose:LPS heptosyltransferase
MMRILVVNLTRMGDIIQTTPLLVGLRQRYPDAHLGLLVQEGFSGATQMIQSTDEILLWDQDEAYQILYEASNDLARPFLWNQSLVHRLRGEGWDLVVNVTHSSSSALLSRLLSRGEVLGIATHADGCRHVENDWAKYFFTVTGNRGVNDFNIVDLYRRIADLQSDEGVSLELKPPPGTWESLCNRFLPLQTEAAIVLLQPGASQENRRWPTERFADVTRRIASECPAQFVVIGGKTDQELGEHLTHLCGPGTLNLVGITSLPELAALCAHADLLITNDTGPLHVAASQGLKSVSLFFATALPAETGPWLPGSLMLQTSMECAPCSHQVLCPHVMCKESISVEAVVAASLHLLTGRDLSLPALEGTLLWRSRKDSWGCMALDLLTPTAFDVHTFVTSCYRRLWHEMLGNRSPETATEDFKTEFMERLESYQSPIAPEVFLHEIDDFLGAIATLRAFAQEGYRLTRKSGTLLQHKSVDVLKELIQDICTLDDRIFRLELVHELVRPLGALFRFDRQAMEDDPDIMRLNRRMLQVYSDLNLRATRLESLLGSALSMCRDHFSKIPA